MTTMADIQAALTACGVAYRMDGWAPAKAPSGEYAVIRDEVQTVGSDDTVSALAHSTVIALYDAGLANGHTLRCNLTTALATRGIHHKRFASEYFYEEKVYQTVYELTDWVEKGI